MEVFRANLQLLEDQPSGMVVPHQQFVSQAPACSVLNNNSVHYHQGQGQQILKQLHTADLSVPPGPGPVVVSKLKAAPALISLQSARDHKFMPY